MQYKILYQDAFPIIECFLNKGEFIKAESDAMIAMSSTLDIEGKVEGNIVDGFARKLLSGESFFLQQIKAVRDDGYVLLGHALPGGIIDVDLDDSYDLIVQKTGFLAAQSSISVNTKMQNLLQGLFSREGFFVLKLSGRGTIFLSSYGAIHPINLRENEEFIIDNGHLVAWPSYMKYKIEKASNGWLSSIMSGECLVCRFKGPGVILIQTRNLETYKEWIRSVGPSR